MKRTSRTRIAATARSQPLPKSEWDFSAVPDDEIEACYYYECSREFFKKSRTLQHLKASWVAYQNWRRSSWKPGRTVPLRHRIGLMAQEYAERILSARTGISIPVGFHTFPEINWQNLKTQPKPNDWQFKFAVRQATERRRRLKYAGDRLHIETIAQLRPTRISNLSEWIRYHNCFRPDENLAQTEYGYFAANWNYSIPEIKAAFHEWLSEMDAKRGKKRKAQSGRGGIKDKLTLIGGLRLFNHYPYGEITNYPESRITIRDSPYQNYSDLSKAAQKAKREIDRMFPTDRKAELMIAQPLADGISGLTLEDIPVTLRN